MRQISFLKGLIKKSLHNTFSLDEYMTEDNETIESDQIYKAVDSAAKLEVLKTVLAVAKVKKKKSKVDNSDSLLQTYRAAAKEPLTANNRNAHLFNIGETIHHLESQAKDVTLSNHPQKAQLLVQLEYALEKAESTKGHLIQMEKKPEHLKLAQQGLDFLKTFHLAS